MLERLPEAYPGTGVSNAYRNIGFNGVTRRVSRRLPPEARPTASVLVGIGSRLVHSRLQHPSWRVLGSLFDS